METKLVRSTIAMAIVCSFSILPSSAHARVHHQQKRAPTTFECESEAGELVGCLSLPPEAPARAPFRAAEPSGAAQTILVDRSDLSGGDVPSVRILPPNETGKNAINTAMLSALETQDQIRRVELFLKGGPASGGHLRVIESSHSTK